MLLAMNLSQMIESLQPKEQFVLLLVMIGCVTVVSIVLIAVTAGVYASVKKYEHDSELKRELLAQGHSADEIERIINPSDGFSRAIEGWGRRRKG